MPKASVTAQLLVLTFCCSSVQSLRCWVCGQDSSPHDSNPHPKAQPPKKGQPSGNELLSSWCSTSISNASCTPDFYAQEVQCYKELWTVDGKEMIKRGCAQKDARYTRTGCEEQITGAGNFKVVLCLCNDHLCNSTKSLKNDQKFLIWILPIGIVLITAYNPIASNAIPWLS